MFEERCTRNQGIVHHPAGRFLSGKGKILFQPSGLRHQDARVLLRAPCLPVLLECTIVWVDRCVRFCGEEVFVDTPAIECCHVSKAYRSGIGHRPVKAVEDVSFVLEPSLTVGLIGANGAGKSTLIKMIMGLVTPTAGIIRINTEDSRLPAARAGVAFMPETPCLYAHMTVEETLRYVCILEGYTRAASCESMARTITALRLDSLLKRRIGALSKGNRQRVSLAQALVGKPRFVVLDEPMSGMDPPGREHFRALFESLHCQGTGILFSTHILDDVERLCSRVIMLENGSVAYDGAIGTLLERGDKGDRIAVGSIPHALFDSLQREEGCNCRIEEDGSTSILTRSAAATQRILGQLACHGHYPLSVTRRRVSLGQLLYGGAVCPVADS